MDDGIDIRLRTDSIPSSFSPYSSDSAADRIEEDSVTHPVQISNFNNTASAAAAAVVVNDDDSSFVRDDTWSCIIVLVTFWLFGIYSTPFRCLF